MTGLNTYFSTAFHRKILKSQVFSYRLFDCFKILLFPNKVNVCMTKTHQATSTYTSSNPQLHKQYTQIFCVQEKDLLNP